MHFGNRKKKKKRQTRAYICENTSGPSQKYVRKARVDRFSFFFSFGSLWIAKFYDDPAGASVI